MSPPVDPDAEPLPELVRPMLATPGVLPERDDGWDDGWGFEMKWDGVRLVAYVERDGLRLLTRNDRDVTATYPELGGLTTALGEHAAVLDGEVVALDERGRPSFGVLQQRMHVLRPGAELRSRVPVSYLVFDVLHLDGHRTTGRTYQDRRSLLEDLGLQGDHVDTPPHFPGSGADAMAVSREQGLEGVVAKRLGSVYRPGRRSPDWVKVKHARTQDVVVVGWSPGEGRRSGMVGALLLGVHDEAGGPLRYAGQVGTGFSDATLADLGSRLRALARAAPPVEVPARDAKEARWVTPRLVGEVVFTEWTRDGRLRHPSWRGLRPDRTADEVVAEA